MAKAPSSDMLARLKGILAFFIGIFGAMAILGVFFKILKLDHYQFFMKVGFIGEAAAFVTMGVFELMGALTTKASRPSSQPAPVLHSKTAVREMETRIKSEVDSLFLALGEDVKRFQVEVRELAAEMELARTTIHGMRAELDSVASGSLARDAGVLGSGMSQLGDEMRGAGSTVQRIRGELEEMANRFSYFNRGPGRAGDRVAQPPTRVKEGATGKVKKIAANA